MFKTFNKLAQANVDHYNEHPKRHTAFVLVLLAVAWVVTNKLAKRTAQKINDSNTYYLSEYAEQR